MSFPKRNAYTGLGALLVLALTLGGRGHHGGRHHGPGGSFTPDLDPVAPELEAPADA